MGAVTRRSWMAGAAAMVAASLSNPSWAQSLFAQSSSAMLAREFTDESLNYELVEFATGAVVASRWDDAERRVPIGSLAKPFAALAYSASHSTFPRVTCRGVGCWLPKGHGEIGIEKAISYSCNAYFRELANDTERSHIDEVVERFGAGMVTPGVAPDQYFGIGHGWKMSPAELSAAYRKLYRTRDDEAVAIVLRGMERAAREGTASPIAHRSRAGALAKTGTAVCSHSVKASGDGFVVAMFPAVAPRSILVVRRHGHTGAQTAQVAAQILRRLEDGSGAA